MKRFFIIIFFSFVYTCYGQNSESNKKDNILEGFIEIKIRSGYTSYGTISITLQREGLIYWQNPFLAGLPEEAMFIPFTELDSNKVIEIWKYVFDQKLHQIERLPEENHFSYDSTKHLFVQTIPPHRVNHIALTFVIHEKNKHSAYVYKYYDKRIDALILMMNELIPLQDRERFSIKGPQP